jgi:hypothetical protein
MSKRVTDEVNAYYPGYKPMNPDKFALMDKLLSRATSPEELKSAVLLFLLDATFSREDLLVVLGRIEREKGWRP